MHSDADATRVLDNFRRIVRALRESSRATERTVGVTSAQQFALQVIAARPAISLNELAEQTRTHQSTVSVVVTRLVEAKLVRRVSAKEDARRRELAVTPKGRALLARAPHVAQERLVEGVERLSSRQRTELRRSLDALVVAMGLGDETPTMFFESPPKPTASRGARRG